MKKMAEKKKASEEAKKLAAEKEYALEHPGFVAESNISTVLKHQKNHKKGILERVEEKIQTAEKEKADDDAGDIMEQALNDPSYVEQIELMKKMKKRGIITDEKASKEDVSLEDKTQQYAEKLLGDQ